jgi:hypothetical protein
MYFINMKRLLIILFLLIMAFAPVSCFYMDDAETVDPGDETYVNPAVPPGEVTTLTATTTIANVSVSNPYVRINFSVPVDISTITYGDGNSISLEYDGAPLNYGAEYTSDPDPLTEAVSAINLIITATITAGTIISPPRLTVILSSAITADSNSSTTLTPLTDSTTTIGN